MNSEAIALPVERVTLSEDRAHVTRAGRVTLPAGLSRLSIRGVAPVLSDKTLGARALSEGVQVIDARVTRAPRLVDADRPARTQALEAELRELEAELAQQQAALKVHSALLAELGELQRLRLAEWSQDVARGGGFAGSAEALEGPRAGERDQRRRCAALRQEIGELERRRVELTRRLEASGTPATGCEATAVVELRAAAAGEVTLELDYIVPGAFWRPYHRARLGEGRVQFETEGCVWQNTGEDWEGVALTFSTERPSLGVSPPRLAADVLRARKTDSTVAVETRQEEIQVTGVGGAAGRAKPALPGIDDGGEAMSLAAAARADVPSDGRPYRVPIAAFEAPAEVDRVLMPELSRAVFLRSRQANQGPRPVLAGPVDLVRDSGLMGRTSVLFVAPGERFELGWGPEPDLRVHREATQEDDESRMLSSWSTTRHKLTLRLSNLGGQARTVQLTERVPVSEVEQVQISVSVRETTDGAQPDKDGLVRWTVALAPRGRATVELAYSVRRHKDVVGL
jgi:uncharacterized protein (TIGR02231 family)